MRVAIVLAAGLSRRFGTSGKLLARWRGRPLLLHAVDRARDSGVRRIIVVVGSRRARVMRLLASQRDVRILPAFNYRAGVAASLSAGLRELRPIEREVLIFLGDMPLAATPRTLRLGGGMDAARPMFRAAPGHPLLVRASAARASIGRGDRGLALNLNRARLRFVAGRAGNLLDIDSQSALRRLRRRQWPISLR